MEPTAITIDWQVAIALLASALGPTVLGFVQQLGPQWVEKAPWYLKGLISSGISALVGMITTTIASGDAMLGLTTGAILGSVGSVNIAFRKGTRGNLEAVTTKRVMELEK